MSRFFSYAFTSLLLLSCASCKNSDESRKKIILTNTLDVERPDELIVLSREQLQTKLGNLDNKFIYVTDEEGEEFEFQSDDLDRDGKWDEIAFLYSFKPKGTVSLFIEASDQQPSIKTAIKRAHVRLRKKSDDNLYGSILFTDTMPHGNQANDFSKVPIPYYQTEGPAWENDKVAFRIYLDVRNGKDIFGKTTPGMMMDTVGVEGDIHYHQKSDWGMDILKVGKSLGAGSLAFRIPFNGKDTLVRLGGDSITQTVYECVADGPLRAILRLHYNNWHPLPGIDPINVTDEISITAGKYFYESKVTEQHLPNNSKLVTGIVNIHSKIANKAKGSGCQVLYTYDKQSENNDGLGLGLIMSDKYFKGFGETSNDSTAVIQHTYTVDAGVEDQPVSYRFYAGWAPSDKMFERAQSFGKFMKNESILYNNKIKIDW